MMKKIHIVHYLNNQATSQEKQELLEWLKSDEKNKAFFHEVCTIWQASTAACVTEADVNEAFGRFEMKLNRYESALEKTPDNTPRFAIGLSFISKVVASVAILLACGTGAFYVGRSVGTNKSATTVVTQTLVMKQALMGQESKGSLTLPDGTKVWLNAGSMLTYPAEFAASSRQVSLEGEAYFEVVEDAKKPFHVSTSGMDVKVLGTVFDVQNSNDRNVAEAVLLSGKVEVTPEGDSHPVVLLPNQMIRINKETGGREIRTVDAREYAIWINDKLSFTNEPLSDILRKMGRWYSVEVHIAKSVPLDMRLSLTIRKESKDEILKLLALIAPIRYRVDEDRVYIDRK